MRRLQATVYPVETTFGPCSHFYDPLLLYVIFRIAHASKCEKLGVFLVSHLPDTFLSYLLLSAYFSGVMMPCFFINKPRF